MGRGGSRKREDRDKETLIKDEGKRRGKKS